MIQRKTIFLTAALLLTACNSAQDSAGNVLDTVGNETGTTYNKVRDLFDVSPKPKPGKPVQASYCYKTFEDIVCYAKPLPGQEERLVGYQNAAGKTGYTLPPTKLHGGTSDDVSTTKQPPVQPLPTPGGPDTSDNKQLKEIIFDPSELEPKELVPDKPQ